MNRAHNKRNIISHRLNTHLGPIVKGKESENEHNHQLIGIFMSFDNLLVGGIDFLIERGI